MYNFEKTLRAILIAVCLLISISIFSQQLFTPTEIANAYKKETRSINGKAGKNYWQNRADYNIHVSFNPVTNLLQGQENIIYFNNSPDTLIQIIVRLYPDLYKKGVPRLTSIKEEDLNNGVSIDSFKIGEESIFDFDAKTKAFHEGTNLIIRPGQNILPHTKTELSIGWHYTVNTGSPQRTGRVDSTSYFIAYFFPRISVYDDVNGWDDWSYSGTQEFYNDFGNFNVDISVPQKFVVWATGDNINRTQNFSEHVLDNLKIANTSDNIIHVN